MQKNLCIIGVGNPLRRDDAIGVILLEYLQKKQKKYGSNISFIDGGTGGINIVHVLSQHTIVLLIDAVDFKATPGESRFFSYDEIITCKEQQNLSTHISDIFSVVQLAYKLGQQPVHLYIFGIQPDDVSYGQGLSKSIEKNLTNIKKNVTEKVQWMIDTYLQE